MNRLSPAVAGLLMATAAFFLFTCFDATVKLLVTRYPVFEAMGAGFFLSSFFVLFWAWLSNRENFADVIRPRKIRLHLARGIVQFVANGLITLSLTHIGLAEFYVIVFLCPIIVVFLAAFFLRERLTAATLITAAVSFAGVVVALRPEGSFSVWTLAAFGGTVAIAFVNLIVRKMAETETPLSPAISVGWIVGAPSLILAAATGWVMPDWADAGVMLLGGLFFGAAQIFLVRAFRCAPAGVISMPQFLQFIYGAAIGYVLFGDAPVPWTYVGGAMVIGANLFLFWSQRRGGPPSRA